MKKTFVFALCTGVCLPFFSGCVDNAYDISDENLEKKAVISGDGIDVSLIKKLEITLKEQIDKLYPESEKTEDGYDLKWDEDGLAYFTYGGLFPVDLPEFDLPEIKVDPVKISIDIPGGSGPMGPLGPQSLGETNANVDATVNVDGGEITIEDIKKIAFKSMKTKIKVKLQRLVFSDDENALIKIKVSFPEAFKLAPMEGLVGTDFTTELSVSELADDEPLLIAEIQEIDYSEGQMFEFAYSAELTLNNNQTVTMNSPELQFEVETKDIQIDYIDAKISGTQQMSGEFGEFDDIKDKFAGNTLAFSNPSLTLDFTTDLGVDFNVDLELNGIGLNKLMNFEKPASGQKTTSYVLSPKQEDASGSRKFGIDKLFETFPDKMGYEVALTIDDANAHIQPNLKMDAAYTFKLPFDFSEIKLIVRDTLENAFKESMYDDILKKLTGTYLEITGTMNMGDTGMNLDLSVEILDEDKLPLDDLLMDKNVLNGNDLSIKIDLKKTEELKKARHLAFKFTLSGKGVRITDTASISIDNLHLVSDGGYEIDF